MTRVQKWSIIATSLTLRKWIRHGPPVDPPPRARGVKQYIEKAIVTCQKEGWILLLKLVGESLCLLSGCPLNFLCPTRWFRRRKGSHN